MKNIFNIIKKPIDMALKVVEPSGTASAVFKLAMVAAPLLLKNPIENALKKETLSIINDDTRTIGIINNKVNNLRNDFTTLDAASNIATLSKDICSLQPNMDKNALDANVAEYVLSQLNCPKEFIEKVVRCFTNNTNYDNDIISDAINLYGLSAINIKNIISDGIKQYKPTSEIINDISNELINIDKGLILDISSKILDQRKPQYDKMYSKLSAIDLYENQSKVNTLVDKYLTHVYDPKVKLYIAKETM